MEELIHAAGPLVVIVTFVALALVATAFHYRRASSLLEDWATENGYRLLSRERRKMWRGPFFFTTGKGQEVYRVTVLDQRGQVRNGYVRCGGRFLGMFSENVEVRWDPPPKEPVHQPGFPVVLRAEHVEPAESASPDRRRWQGT